MLQLRNRLHKSVIYIFFYATSATRAGMIFPTIRIYGSGTFCAYLKHRVVTYGSADNRKARRDVNESFSSSSSASNGWLALRSSSCSLTRYTENWLSPRANCTTVSLSLSFPALPRSRTGIYFVCQFTNKKRGYAPRVLRRASRAAQIGIVRSGSIRENEKSGRAAALSQNDGAC